MATSEEAYNDWMELQGQNDRDITDGPSGAQTNSAVGKSAKTARNWMLPVIGIKAIKHATRGKKARRIEQAKKQEIKDAKKRYEELKRKEEAEAERKANARYEREMRLKESYAKPADTTHPMAYNMDTIAEM